MSAVALGVLVLAAIAQVASLFLVVRVLLRVEALVQLGASAIAPPPASVRGPTDDRHTYIAGNYAYKRSDASMPAPPTRLPRRR